jgi:TetR/AcrR family transcriptional repressor of lmrAB and yxaGH operons
MTQPAGRTRDRMLLSAVTLLRERGRNGVTLDAVLAHSGAPRGSIYHHFPGGRDQLVLEAAQLGSDFIAAMIDQAGADPDLALDRFVDFWKQSLVRSDFRAGCPIVAVVVDGQERPELDALADDAFKRWSEGLIGMLTQRGIDADEAARVASATISAIEGAVILCRVQRSTDPLDHVAALLRAHVASITG